MDQINRFGPYSGYKVNKNKTKMLLNMTKEEEVPLEKLTGWKYLGVNLIEQGDTFYKENYQKTWIKITKYIKYWEKLRISWLGQISIVKMNILPKLNLFISDITYSY